MRQGRPRSVRRTKSTVKRVKARSPKQRAAATARNYTRKRKGR